MRCFVVVAMLVVVGCSDNPVDEIEPEDELGELCLVLDREQLHFEVARTGEVLSSSVTVTSCDGSAFGARVALDGEGFVAAQRVLGLDGVVRYAGALAEVERGARLAIDVTYLARDSDDGTESTLTLRAFRDGEAGVFEVSLSGIVRLADDADTNERATIRSGRRRSEAEPEEDRIPGGTRPPNGASHAASGSPVLDPDYSDNGDDPAPHHPCAPLGCSPLDGGVRRRRRHRRPGR